MQGFGNRMRIRKAVIPAAGFGTRWLPATRSVPKPLLPVLDTPAVSFAVKEAAEAGITDIVIVVSPGHEAIGAYFNPIPSLEQALEERGQNDLLEQMKAIPQMAEVKLLVQEEQLGLGHAVLQARSAIGEEPFAVLLPDEIFWNDEPFIGEVIDVFDERQGSVIAVQEVPDAMVSKLGIVRPERVANNLFLVKEMVEKPSLEKSPSNLAIVGRYVLTSDIFELLENTVPGAGGEIQLTDAIGAMIPDQSVYAYRTSAQRFDVGTPDGMLKASVYYALRRNDIATEFRGWLEKLLREDTL